MTLPDPYRGHAQPTWDTKTLATLIALLGGVGNAPATGGGYATATFADVFMSNQSPYNDPLQTVPNAQWITLNLARKTTDAGNNFNTGTHFYVVPATGLYVCQALIRFSDDQIPKGGFPDGTGIGIGIGTSNVDFPGFQWNKWMWMSGTGGNRLSLDYTRIAACTAGDPLRLYTYADGGVSYNVYSATMQIYRIG